MNSLETLLSTSFVMMALGTSAIVYVIGLIVNYVFLRLNRDMGNSIAWKDMILPMLPMIIGVMLGYLTNDGMLTGLVAGLLSGLMFRVIKAMLLGKAKQG